MKRELVMGINAVSGLADTSPERIVRVWIKRSGKRLDALAEQLKKAGVSVEWADERALDRRANGERHQGVIAEFQAREPINEHDLIELIESANRDPLVLVLDGVQDPHNLGACLRSAVAAGAIAVVTPKDRATGLTPAARRAAAGAAELISLAVVTNLARTLVRLGDHGVRSIGLAGESDNSLFATDLTGPLALVLGGEEHGLRRLTRERCDQLACIPMRGATESLNVSVAAGISLFEAVRQRLA